MVTYAAIFVFLFLNLCIALKHDLNYVINNGFSYDIIIQEFGVSKYGTLHLEYSIQTEDHGSLPPPYILFLFLKQSQFNDWYKYKLVSSIDSATLTTVCNQPSEYRIETNGTGSIDYVTTKSDQYAAVIINCFRDSNKFKNSLILTGEVGFSSIALESIENPKQYLDISRVMDIQISLWKGIAFSVMLIISLGQFYINKRNDIDNIQYMFIAFSLFCTITSFYSYSELISINNTGIETDVQKVLYYLAYYIEYITILFTFLILSLGWAIVRIPTKNEINFVILLLSLMTIIGIWFSSCAKQNIDHTTFACNALDFTLYAMKGALVISIILGVNFTLSQIKASLDNLPWTADSTPILYIRLWQFNSLRNTYVFLLFYPVVLNILYLILVDWRTFSNLSFISEMIKICIFFYLGYVFSPVDLEIYSRPFDGSLNGIRNGDHIQMNQ